MPIENASVQWSERLPLVPVARLRLPAQRFDSDQQLALADVLRYSPWHSLAEHKPLGNSNHARRQMYWELARLRQAMNEVEHVEPSGAEQFPAQQTSCLDARRNVYQERAGVLRLGNDGD